VLTQFADDIWLADGPTTTVMGFRYPTRMAIIRLANGDLFIWSPVALSDNLRESVDALGVVTHIVAPNSLHHLYIDDWRRAYIGAKLYAPPGLREKRKDLVFDIDLETTAVPAWNGEMDHVLVQGNAITTEAVFFHRRSRTVLFTDLIQCFPPDWFFGWRAVVARLDLMVADQPSVPRKFRAAFVNRRAARASIAHILTWPTEKVIMAHGEPVSADGRAFITRTFRWLLGGSG
jgi:Domain of unknown function (DUF4336)